MTTLRSTSDETLEGVRDHEPAYLAETGCTVREAQVLTHICRGLSNQEIALELDLSITAVKAHIRGAYRKVGLTRRAQIVAWGAQQDL